MNQALIGGDRVRSAYLGTTRGGHFCHGKHSCDVCWCLQVTPAAPRAAPRPPPSPPSRHWAPPRRPRRPPPPPPPEGVRAVPRKRWRAGSGAARGPAAAGWRCRYRGTRGPARPGPGSALAAAAGGACYSELLDLSTMLVASTYKSKATDTPEENQTAIPPVTCVTSSTPLFCGCHRTKSRINTVKSTWVTGKSN
nr:mulatexin-like [Anas platyrhynchos]